MKPQWLDRRIAHPGPYLTLCLSDKEYRAALKQCGVTPIGDWIKTDWADATAHHMSNPKGEAVCVICLRVGEGRTPVEIAGLLVHEAVHAWQDYCHRIGETDPGSEQEAYGIQSIAQELMAEYARRVT